MYIIIKNELCAVLVNLKRLKMIFRLSKKIRLILYNIFFNIHFKTQYFYRRRNFYSLRILLLIQLLQALIMTYNIMNISDIVCNYSCIIDFSHYIRSGHSGFIASFVMISSFTTSLQIGGSNIFAIILWLS